MSTTAPESGPRGLHRRDFIAAALAFTTGALILRRASADAPADAAAAGASALLGTLDAPAAAARIGRAYLGTQPQEADLDSLVQQLSEALAAQGGAVPDTREAMLDALARTVSAEYCAGDLVRADGWLLAPSEARLYALAALAGTAGGGVGG